MNTQCPICQATMNKAFRARVLRKHDVDYFWCSGCGFLKTEVPHWLEEAYGDAITTTDTGLAQRNLHIAKRLAPLLYFCFDRDGSYLDVAAGYGMLVRLMRDDGLDFYWDDKYCANLMARGFEAASSKRPFSALTAFEVLEHVPDPMAFIGELMDTHRTRTLIFSTEFYAGTTPPPPSWWYYAFETGQHISFYQHRTWQTIADRLGLRFLSFRGLHILTDRNTNPLAASAVSGRMAGLLSMYVRKQLGTKVQADHKFMIQQLQ